jgi:hypothetical protein
VDVQRTNNLTIRFQCRKKFSIHRAKLIGIDRIRFPYSNWPTTENPVFIPLAQSSASWPKSPRLGWGLIFHVMPWIGLELLDMALAVADFDVPAGSRALLSQRITMAIADDTQDAETLAVCPNLYIMCSQAISPIATDFCCPAVVLDRHATLFKGGHDGRETRFHRPIPEGDQAGRNRQAHHPP